MIRIALLACAVLSSPAVASEPLPGPVPAETLRVIDGDTVEVRARIWPSQYVETRVRLADVDAPERRGPDCEAERARAGEATDFTRAWLQSGAIALEDIDLGSFAGRVIARIRRADGADLSDDLLAAGLAAPYGAQAPWCGAGPESR